MQKNDEISLCGSKTGEKRYDCQVTNYCDSYKTKEIIHKSESYFETDETGEKNLFESAKEKYRENQNAIYACSVIKLQKNSYNLVLNKLSKIDNGGTLISRINQKLSLKLKKLESIEKQKECTIPGNKEEGNSLQFKQKLLNESAYEYCKYNFYLDFLNNHFNDIQNSNKEYFSETEEKTDSFKVSQIAGIQSKLKQDIVNEQNHSAKVFNIAFETYIDYENNHPVHILLELIKEDFIVLRRKLHEAISPINQVVYKISNAMSIN
ncbi:MAG: hypothetical protein Q9M97_04955 [Candidatus Gracilibacteria bacterium]|nr:hypothetical protein [Candidatus Gracilibacteria bacterium]